MNNAVIGVVHPVSIKYFDDYLSSINKQIYKNFTLFVFGDKIKYNDIEAALSKYNDVDIVFNELDDNLSISKARQKVLDYVKERNFDNCIFTDTDDFYHENYVKYLSKYLSEYDIVFSDLSIFFSKENIIEGYFKKCNIPQNIDKEYILDKNCIGLGHSGIKMDIYEKNKYTFPDDIIAVDWWLFTVLMNHNDCEAFFIDKSLAHYRQHNSNTAGFLNISQEKILHAVKVKMLHYKNLINYDKVYENNYESFKNLYMKVTSNEEFRKRYIEYVHLKYNNKKYLWWEYAEQQDTNKYGV